MGDEKYLVVVKGCGFAQPLRYLEEEESEPAELIVQSSQKGNTTTQNGNSEYGPTNNR